MGKAKSLSVSLLVSTFFFRLPFSSFHLFCSLFGLEFFDKKGTLEYSITFGLCPFSPTSLPLASKTLFSTVIVSFRVSGEIKNASFFFINYFRLIITADFDSMTPSGESKMYAN